MPAGADSGAHSVKPRRAWRPGWVFAVGLSLLVHVGLAMVFWGENVGSAGRTVPSAWSSRVIDAQLLPGAVPVALEKPAARLRTPPQQPSQGGPEGHAPMVAQVVYLEPSQVDLTAQPLEDPVVNMEHWPTAVDELRVAVWVSDKGAIVDWRVQGVEADDSRIAQMFAEFGQTRMTPAFRGGHPVASVLYLALSRP